jgi:hypothetical protein
MKATSTTKIALEKVLRDSTAQPRNSRPVCGRDAKV